MIKENEKVLLKIRVNSSETKNGVSVYEQIILRAKGLGLKGATATKAIIGYIGDGEIQKPRLLSLTENLPVIIEIIDTGEKINQLMSELDGIIENGLVSVERVNSVCKHRGSQ